jgi:hypothetical protein
VGWWSESTKGAALPSSLAAKTMCGHGAGESPKRAHQSEFFRGLNNQKKRFNKKKPL